MAAGVSRHGAGHRAVDLAGRRSAARLKERSGRSEDLSGRGVAGRFC